MLNEKSPEDKRHNWFTVKGDIRIEESMSTPEFIDFLDSIGIEFLGSVGVSDFTDELYEGTQYDIE